MLILLLIVFVTNDRNCNKHAADAVHSSSHVLVIEAEGVHSVVNSIIVSYVLLVVAYYYYL